LAKQFEKGRGETAAPTKGQRKKYNIERTLFRDQPVWSYPGNDTLIYYVHGGGFIAGFSYFYFPMMGAIAQQSGASLVAPDYPLYPNIDARGTHEWIRAHYDETVERLKPSKVILMGDSAGANAAMVLAQDLARSGLSADRLVLLCPWIDLRMVHPDMVQYDEEQLLDGSKAPLAAERHAGALGLDHPLISPIFGDLASLPPTWIFTADKDLLHPDIMGSVEKMRAEDLNPSLDLAEGLAHVYMLLPTPEGKAGLSRIAKAAQFP
jgi:acetyl esterase/lipase